MTASTDNSEASHNGPFSGPRMLYALAIIAAAIAAFGIGGVAVAALVLVLWAFLLGSQSCRATAGTVLATILLGSYLLSLLLPAVNGGLSGSRMQCTNNLKRIALALHDYHANHGSFPPAYATDDDGTPLHSWRTLILPYLEEHALYEAYDFNEPWDGPNNRKLSAAMPDIYRCPAAEQAVGLTSYVAVVGESTAWPGASGRSIEQIADGTSETLLVVEHHGHDVLWLEPADPGIEPFLADLTADGPELDGHQRDDYFSVESAGREVALADGSVRWLSHGLKVEDWRKLLIVDDGSGWSDVNYPREVDVRRRYRPGNIVSAAILAVLVLLPLPRVWLRR